MRSVIALLSRHRLASALGLIVLLRAALPYALRPVLERQASQAINAHVTIGDVDLALHRAGIALEDVAVHPVTWTPETDTGEPPLIAWKRFAVAVRWLPLFQKTVQLRELVLESPRVALDRLQDGGLNVAALAPASEENAAPAEKSSWRFGIDRIVLRDGGVRFRDLMFERERPVELALGSFEVEDIALTPGVYGEPARMRLKANVDEGQFALDAGFTPRDDGGFVVTSRVKARRLPLRRTRVYIPKVGWSALDGEVGGVFEYTLETGRPQRATWLHDGERARRPHPAADGARPGVEAPRRPGGSDRPRRPPGDSEAHRPERHVSGRPRTRRGGVPVPGRAAHR